MLPLVKGLYDCSLPRKGVELVAVVAGTAGSLRLHPSEPMPSLNDDEAILGEQKILPPSLAGSQKVDVRCRYALLPPVLGRVDQSWHSCCCESRLEIYQTGGDCG